MSKNPFLGYSNARTVVSVKNIFIYFLFEDGSYVRVVVSNIVWKLGSWTPDRLPKTVEECRWEDNTFPGRVCFFASVKNEVIFKLQKVFKWNLRSLWKPFLNSLALYKNCIFYKNQYSESLKHIATVSLNSTNAGIVFQDFYFCCTNFELTVSIFDYAQLNFYCFTEGNEVRIKLR